MPASTLAAATHQPLNPRGSYSTFCTPCGEMHPCELNNDGIWVIAAHLDCPDAGKRPDNYRNAADVG